MQTEEAGLSQNEKDIILQQMGSLNGEAIMFGIRPGRNDTPERIAAIKGYITNFIRENGFTHPEDIKIKVLKMRNRIVLHVEDDPDLARYFKVAFRTFACDYYQCSNGVEALEWLKTNTPSIIITDMMMPRMGGLEMAEKIRQDFPRLKKVSIVFVTAFDSEDMREAATKSGGVTTRIYSKPVRVDALKDIVEKMSSD